MSHLITYLLMLFLLLISGTIALGQEIDKNLIVGKWKFVKATTGGYERAYEYNGNPLLTFEKNGNWITEDSNPNYRQSGTWQIENNILIRDPEVAGSGNKQPYLRIIDKLTQTELVFYAATEEGVRTFTFYFTRIE